ncbi:hypothetical protein K501DRAFT_335752 [Backusella circina FSU 941]|nr:hypothetical protein K501DRAFT_335752 [Backusella circina FSU 941]
MLRPSKIFVSFHQLRHYFETKITELVRQPHTANQIIQIKQPTQQSILFFSNAQSRFFQAVFPNPTKQFNQPFKAYEQQARLLKAIQHHFPVVKVFSPLNLNQRMWNAPIPGQQLRTMMSGSPYNPSTTSSTMTMTGLTWGFPRTATLGGRNPAFARQFSTTKSPCVTLFQNTTATAGGNQTNVFTHVSSRIFTSAGGKMNQPPTPASEGSSENQSRASMNKGHEQLEENPISYNRIFAVQNQCKGMGELVSQECVSSSDNESINGAGSPRLVRRESVIPPSSSRKYKTSSNKNNSMEQTKKLDSIICHDELSSLYNHRLGKRKNHGKHGRTKPMIHDHHPVRKKEKDTHGSTVSHHSNKSNKGNEITTVYLLITLDTSRFANLYINSNDTAWSTGSLDASFIASVQSVSRLYQIHLQYVLQLLQKLEQHGDFRVVIRNQTEVRVYFPAFLDSREDAIQLLHTLSIDPNSSDYFSIVEDRFQVDGSKTRTQSSLFSFNSDSTNDDGGGILGPEYFSGIRTFLDQIDELVDTGPAFSRSAAKM